MNILDIKQLELFNNDLSSDGVSFTANCNSISCNFSRRHVVNSPSRISVFVADINVESSKVFAYNDFRLHGEEVGSVSVSTKHVQTCWAVRIGWLEMAGLAWAEAFILKGKELEEPSTWCKKSVT